MKVIYATSEKFMLDFINSIQNNNSTKFAQYYRNVDILILDDVQFFQSKEQTQDILCDEKLIKLFETPRQKQMRNEQRCKL